MSTAPMPVVIYTRVSTIEQATAGTSLAEQRARLERWAKDNGHQVSGAYSDEGISGRTIAARPGVRAAIDHACRLDGGAIAVSSLTRLGRSTIDILTTVEQLRRAGAKLISLSEAAIDGTPGGVAMLTIMSAVGQLERDLIASRTRENMGHLKRMGKRVGTVPFGFRVHEDGQTLRPVEAEQQAIVLMQRLRSEGASLREVGRCLEDAGIPPKTGAHWHSSVIAGVLRRAAEREAVR